MDGGLQVVDVCLDPFEVPIPYSLDVFHALLALHLARSLHLLLQPLQFPLYLLYQLVHILPFVHGVAQYYKQPIHDTQSEFIITLTTKSNIHPSPSLLPNTKISSYYASSFRPTVLKATAAIFSPSSVVYSNNKLRQQIVVRMGNESVSRFHDGLQWVSLSKKGCKEVVQSKSTREIVEKYTLEHVDPEEVKREGLIYQWRTHKRAARFTVEIYEMKYMSGEDDSNCFLRACQRPDSPNHKLAVYTEHIHKLYQNSTRFLFPEKEQFRLFAEILHAIDQLSQKFGYFMISKEMIGYNSKMAGKVWINENFASNFVQFKRQIHTKGDREKWQASIIENIIDICRLCTTEVNANSNKFQYVINQIRDNRLFSFPLYERFTRSMGYEGESLPRDSSSLQKRMSSQDRSRKVGSNECSSKMQIVNSKGKQSIKEVNSSTKDCKDTKFVKEKRFVMVPVVNIKKLYPVTEQQRQYINDVRNSSRYSHEVRQNSLIASPLRQNYVEVERHTQSYIKKSHQIYKINSEISKPLDSILEIPLKSAQFNDMSDAMRDSSLLSSPHEQILMVDSMIVVQNQGESEQLVRKDTKFILEESVILRGQD